jgi:hypothetical protein
MDLSAVEDSKVEPIASTLVNPQMKLMTVAQANAQAEEQFQQLLDAMSE